MKFVTLRSKFEVPPCAFFYHQDGIQTQRCNEPMEKIAEPVDEYARVVVRDQVEGLILLVRGWVVVTMQEIRLLLVVLLMVVAALLLGQALVSVLGLIQ